MSGAGNEGKGTQSLCAQGGAAERPEVHTHRSFADENDQFLRAGNGGVDEVAIQHVVVLRANRHAPTTDRKAGSGTAQHGVAYRGGVGGK